MRSSEELLEEPVTAQPWDKILLQTLAKNMEIKSTDKWM